MADGSRTGRRASDLGLLPITLSNYVQLLQWTAVQLGSGQRDTIPVDLVSVLDRFEVQPDPATSASAPTIQNMLKLRSASSDRRWSDFLVEAASEAVDGVGWAVA